MAKEILIGIITPIACILIGAFLGYYLTRWQKHKEVFYARKIEVYSSFISELFNFRIYCLPGGSFRTAFISFIKLNAVFYDTGLFMPQSLFDDIHKITRSVFDGLIALRGSIIRTGFDGGVVNAEDVGMHCFEKTIHRLHSLKIIAETLDDSSPLPGPYETLINKSYEIMQMLKKDLGVEKFSGKFYAKF